MPTWAFGHLGIHTDFLHFFRNAPSEAPPPMWLKEGLKPTKHEETSLAEPELGLTWGAPEQGVSLSSAWIEL